MAISSRTIPLFWESRAGCGRHGGRVQENPVVRPSLSWHGSGFIQGNGCRENAAGGGRNGKGDGHEAVAVRRRRRGFGRSCVRSRSAGSSGRAERRRRRIRRHGRFLPERGGAAGRSRHGYAPQSRARCRRKRPCAATGQAFRKVMHARARPVRVRPRRQPQGTSHGRPFFYAPAGGAALALQARNGQKRRAASVRRVASPVPS